MGLDKCYLPDVETLKKQLLSQGLEKFVEKYLVCDIFIGEVGSVDFVNLKISEWKLLINFRE